MNKPKYILTGTTGAGKTTIVRRLAELQQRVVPESFMDVFWRLRNAGVADPLAEESFIDEVVASQLERITSICPETTGPIFCDRSPLCTLALSNFMGRRPSPDLRQAVDRSIQEATYSDVVFFVANLGFSPGNEVARLSFSDLVRFEDVHRQVYTDHGFSCVDIPPLTVDQRVEQILNHVASETSRLSD